jgi:hypothetical protein
VDEVDFTHIVFGLTLRSNLPLPGLSLLEEPPKTVDVEILLGAAPNARSKNPQEFEEVVYTSSYTDESGKPTLQIRAVPGGSLLHLVYYDGMQFWVDRKGRFLWAAWPSAATLEDAASYLLGPVFGILLRLRGVTCLHASAVRFEERGVLFVGPEGAGKSTTAAAFAQQGLAVICDDVAALLGSEEGFRVMPAPPHLCLWPDSVKMLYGTPDALPQLTPGWNKRRLGGEGARFENRPLPLGAIYILGDRRPERVPYVQKIGPQDALVSLVAETYANKILDRELRAREFAVLGQLVSSVPVRRVFLSRDATRLENLCRVIREDYASLGSLTSTRH